MNRALTRWVTQLSLAALTMASPACGETAGSTRTLSVYIESQDQIVSEDGALELLAGTLEIQSVSLIGDAHEVRLLGPVTLDLSVPNQELRLLGRAPTGSYRRIRVVLAAGGAGDPVLDVEVRGEMTGDTARALSWISMEGDADFPEGARSVTESSDLELHIDLRGMFFYLAPLSDAVEGVFTAEERHRDFLRMDLVGMFDLRVLP